MKKRDDSKPFSRIVQLDMMPIGAAKNTMANAVGATGKIPFVPAVETNKQSHPIAMRLSPVAAFSKEEIKNWARKHLATGCTVVSDSLNCFRALKEEGFHHTVNITGGGSESVKIPEFKWVNTIIGNVKRSIHGCLHAVSENHFSRYLAEYCYRFNRRFDLRQLIPRFCYVALRTQPYPQRVLKLAEVHG